MMNLDKCFYDAGSRALFEGMDSRHSDFLSCLQHHRKVLEAATREAVKQLVDNHQAQKVSYFESVGATYEGFQKLEEAHKQELEQILKQPELEIEKILWNARSKTFGFDLWPIKEFLQVHHLSWELSEISPKYLSQHLDKKLKPINNNEKFWAGKPARQCSKCGLQLIYSQGTDEPSRCAVLGCTWSRRY